MPTVARMRTPLLCLCGLMWNSSAGAQPVLEGARTVLTAVVNGQGRAIVDVSLDDFVVTEGGQPREVLDVHVADYPMAVIVDDRPEASGGIPALRSAARRFVQRVGERPVALFTFTKGIEPLTTLEDDRAAVLERLGTIEAGTSGDASAIDTVARAAALLKSSGASFSAVVIIAAAPVDATQLVRGELLPQIVDSGAAVHVVQGQPPDASVPSDPTAPDLLRLIADQTHGQFTAIFSTVSYTAALDRLADRLAIEMMVQYMVPPGPKAGDVQVGVRLPGARVVGLGVR